MSSWHLTGIGVDASLTSLSLNLLSVFGLVDEGSFSSLLDFEPEKELQLSHHGNLELWGHESGKLLIESFVRKTKDNIINIYLAYKQLPFDLLSKKSGVNFPNFKPTILQQLSKVLDNPQV